MAIYGSLTGSPPYWHPLLLSAHLQGDYLSVVLPKWKCGVPEGRWNVLLGNWVVRGNVSYFKADGSSFMGNGETCKTSLRREGQPIQLEK